MTNNLSSVPEQPLTDDMLKQNNARQAKLGNADAAAQGWNAFNERSGSFADEYSTL
jgi:post-segregation antitoxin (ccd killing protein)